MSGSGVDPLAGTTSLSTSQTIGQSGIANRLGCNLVQLQVAWQLRNQTVQSTTVSASSTEQLLDLMDAMKIVPKLTHGYAEDIDKILSNKPSRPPMISTLQQRWATTGG